MLIMIHWFVRSMIPRYIIERRSVSLIEGPVDAGEDSEDDANSLTVTTSPEEDMPRRRTGSTAIRRRPGMKSSC